MTERAPQPIDSVDKACALFAPMLADAAEERLCVAHLTVARVLIGVQICSSGRAETIALPIRDIVADALRRGSRGLILAHNHPGGNPAPSAADLEATRLLARVVAPLGIRLWDHLILAGGQWQSLRALALI
jgi:DNA repair protein RadC